MLCTQSFVQYALTISELHSLMCPHYYVLPAHAHWYSTQDIIMHYAVCAEGFAL